MLAQQASQRFQFLFMGSSWKTLAHNSLGCVEKLSTDNGLGGTFSSHPLIRRVPLALAPELSGRAIPHVVSDIALITQNAADATIGPKPPHHVRDAPLI